MNTYLKSESLQHLMHTAVDLTFGAYCSRLDASPRRRTFCEVVLWRQSFSANCATTFLMKMFQQNGLH